MSISLTVNGQFYNVNADEFPADITLNTFIRNHVELPGTKFMCLEGGCGACIVQITGRHPVTKNRHTWAANSCLTLLNMCDGWSVTTIEGIGNNKIGYHPIQERLAHLGGSQCGYCSPGFVMNMHCLLESRAGHVSMKDVENSFGGNLCRCTGYRPILDAMKSFATDGQKYCENLCQDIEDLQIVCVEKDVKCSMRREGVVREMTLKDGSRWLYPGSLKGVFSALQIVKREPYTFIAGNTGHGVYRRNPTISAFIDVNFVPELHENRIGETLELGANITLTEMMDILTQAADNPGFGYCKKLVKHLDKVANVPVRNMGTIAGNLSLKHQHLEFPSDVFLILETVGTSIVIASSEKRCQTMSLSDYLLYDMELKVITKIQLPPRPSQNFLFKSYKITRRAQNAHAYVNAGFLIKHNNFKISDAKLCFGGIDPSFVHASATERFLIGKSLTDNKTIREAFKILQSEISPDWVLPDASPEYRKKLACGLFYKFLLNSIPASSIRSDFYTGGQELKRELSSGIQTFETHEDKWPLTQPVTKLEALRQTSGEAVYINDLPHQPREVHAAFVLAEEVNVKIVKIDPSNALQIEGTVAFFSAKDIPGINSFVPIGAIAIIENEEIFCSDVVKFHSQPVGVIVAETSEIARRAAQSVKITYERLEKEVVATLKDALEKRPDYQKYENEIIEEDKGVKRIKGHSEFGLQYHFHMETHTTICLPGEDGIKVYSATQDITSTHSAISACLNIPHNKIDVIVTRLGGAFGGKVSRGGQIATACALACWILKRPVRFVQHLESNMAAIGKRNACIFDYDVTADEKGKIKKFNLEFYEDLGCSVNENLIPIFAVPFVPNCYDSTGWNSKGEGVTTDATSHTFCRSPGSLEAIAMTETIMEHIAKACNLDPVDVRMANIPATNKIHTLLPTFIKSIKYQRRRSDIDKFNLQNRWRKRGIGISLMQFPLNYFGGYSAAVSIYYRDGTVAISHGGIEMGQGLNTKAAQVAAYTLGIPLAMVTIKPTNTFNAANTEVTGGSFTSESVCSAVKQACETLLERMKPVRVELKNPTWTDITRKCKEKNINLIANHLYKAGDLVNYIVYGLACTEVEVDVLTGNLLINRVDILEDTGESLSPLVDVGQIEGAFIMGLGYWLTEELIYDRRNGELLTTRTWNYKIPGAKDIPIDFRINLLQKSPNSGGFLRSKATGEPATCMSVSVIFAIRHALDSARKNANIGHIWYNLGAPTTAESIALAAEYDISDFKLQ